MKKLFIVPFIILLVFSILSGCSQSSSVNQDEKQTQKGKLQIYTTIFPLQDFSEKIGGKYVDVEVIVPAGSDAHSYEPTTKTMVNIAEGDAFIYLGTGIEGFADAVVDAVKNEGTKAVNASEGISLIKSTAPLEEDEEEVHEGENEHEGEEKDVDPHVWLDPNRSIQLAENIKNALIEIKPDQKSYFENNFENLKIELENVDKSFKAMVKESTNKTFIVAHSAFGYWADVYGLNQVGISGLSPSSEPSQKKLEEIIKIAEQQEINYILFEQNVENRVAEVLKKEIGAETLKLHNLEALTEEEAKNKEDYVSIMEKNIETLREVLK